MTTTPPKRPDKPLVLGQRTDTPAVLGEPAPAGTGQLDAVSCANAERCWAVGAPAPSALDGPTPLGPPSAAVVDATADGGKTWAAQQLTLTPLPTLTGISCPSTRLCMTVGLSGSGTAGIVLTTHDAGASWAQVSVPTGAVIITSIECAGIAECTAIASDGTTFWSADSTDFGLTWDREGNLPPGLEDAGNLSCVAGASCLVTGFTATTAGHGQGAVAVSTDGGETWTAAAVPSGAGLVQGVGCATISSCLAVGTTSTTVSSVVPARGALLASHDGGHTWVMSAGPQPVDDMYGIDCPSRSICAVVGTDWVGTPAVGTGAVASSRDGGATFTPSSTQYTPLALTALACPTVHGCVAVGGDTVARVRLPQVARPRVHARGRAVPHAPPTSMR